LIALGFLFTPDLSLASPKASIVATINSEMITALQLEKNVRLALLAKGVDPNKVNSGELKDIKKSVLDDLVKESILIQEAKNQNINISDKDVENEIQNSINKAGITKEAFYADLAKQGYDEKFYKDKVKKSLLTQTLINRNVLRKIIVTNDEILEFYLANGGQITGKANVALLVYPNGEQMDTYSEKLLDNPRRFEDIAKNISVGPSADKGGVLGEMAVSDLAVPVQSAIQGLDAGEVSKVFSLNGAYAQVKVLSKTTSSDNLAEIIDPAVVAKIRDGLRMQRVGNKIEEYITGLEKKAIVTIR
ncbi:MAG: SurA N-terminal domain-containing protein, partial [Mailhella sp.]|nr:SurA N-terminal domain-containing protein [Mailhella sp.]